MCIERAAQRQKAKRHREKTERWKVEGEKANR
jgi:hypothetical protein